MRRAPLSVATGVVLVVFTLWLVVCLGAYLLDPAAYDRLQRLQGAPAARILRALVLLAAAFHLADGVVALLETRLRVLDRSGALGSGVVWFVAFALGIPAAVAALWPVITGVPR